MQRQNDSVVLCWHLLVPGMVSSKVRYIRKPFSYGDGPTVGELHTSYKTSMDVLGSSIELLLHALIMNAKTEPECLDAAKDILENGENLNVLGYADEQGNSLLHVACFWGEEEIAELLIDDFDMPLDRKNRSGQSPLICAVANHEITDGTRTS